VCLSRGTFLCLPYPCVRGLALLHTSMRSMPPSVPRPRKPEDLHLHLPGKPTLARKGTLDCGPLRPVLAVPCAEECYGSSERVIAREQDCVGQPFLVLCSFCSCSVVVFGRRPGFRLRCIFATPAPSFGRCPVKQFGVLQVSPILMLARTSPRVCGYQFFERVGAILNRSLRLIVS
jgi:hypothetical protein